ncbi:enoyl-CoA hydratase-related protein [Jannaschia seohaensis]|uniref:Enoyl-CoA hydratase/carnithine racemase n=1 Tax=Jannaschia seohaensis TaxID=475081 RepID=A0A2Y9AQG3_9RHOB|nr:enoyl-CoA hydratase-related protein [Jannaschia seohaensis]PWJ20611.1 enoyl-CoA hydratase/carnithine racemase [Jannaschia seohaensis]SSA44707.1 Enoyl-CoA hydratase/carnithine racemase [Jannaschia seohaensis]
MKGPVHIAQSEGLAWVTIDNPPVNAISAAVRQALAEAVDAVGRMPVAAAVLRCAGRTFVAGGDITEFDAPPVPPDLPDVIRAIEDCPVPWIAAMHGSVFGGGLEIALGCAWRVAVPGTCFALPEVTLGIVPGAGGTQRLPRLVGAALALRMASSGAPVTGETFHEAGGLTALLPDLEDPTLLNFARGLNTRPAPVRSGTVAPMPPSWWADQRETIAKEAGGAVGPLENFQLIAKAADLPFEEGQPLERARHLALRVAPQSRALRHLFLAERAAARPPVPLPLARPALASVLLPGTDRLADRIRGALARAGVDVIEAPRPEAPRPNLILLTGSEDVVAEADLADVPVLRALEPGTAPALAGGGSDVVLCLGPSGAEAMEIAAGPDAPPASVALSLALARRLRLTPVFSVPGPGLVMARIAQAVARHRAACGTTAADIAEAWRRFGGQDNALIAPPEVSGGLEPGLPDPAAQPGPVLQGLLAVLTNECACCVEERQVRGAAAVDVIAVRAFGFPRWRGGPIHYAETVGNDIVAEWMQAVTRCAPGEWRLSTMLDSVTA